jgi:hypothetical protein
MKHGVIMNGEINRERNRFGGIMINVLAIRPKVIGF